MNTIEIERIFNASLFSEYDNGGNVSTDTSEIDGWIPDFPDEGETSNDSVTADVVNYLRNEND